METLRLRRYSAAPLAILAATLFVAGLLALAPAGALAQPDVPDSRFYTVTTSELPIPAPGDGTGNLQANVVCETGDVVVGGGHIIHPSSTTDIFVTKSYGTDATGAFAPVPANRWRVKVLNPEDLAGIRLTVHAVCAKGGARP